MSDRKEEPRKPAHEPKKTKGGERDEGMELGVEELEERIAPMKVV